MKPKELLNRLSRMEQSTREEWVENSQMAEAYPYSVSLRLLALAGAQVWGEKPISSRQMRKEVLISNNAVLPQQLVGKACEYKPVAEHFDVMQEINAYQEISYKTAPKSVILSQYLEDECQQPEQSESAPMESLEVLGKKSITADDTLVSETLAVVYEKQGKIEKAIEMYERLTAKYPEKSSTFANRIAELKSRQE